ncbi:MAG: bifunctional (p)ppGpp synthetase/guanosine-3',5'-bis(diphosphate) 3'-pyrophosphohydrolase [Anaerolineales bacterium]|nr:bifunctional (p)ppGpp synthetase/guanosine-3',5'-bis(diphosphate) 3'-pyrophosphohydrolase [Anaerolineales bacterium]MCX7753678.1 bifunctional (p)ppGpp synthetase/guanosine-3',5'-bis(diphosphate) 3'-pyrophosphohydrolase [Anaerolineales bacterium]MDW8276446.1 bifunctional (p)ppGpp synthetase/guanosine-3',5'-bis(diphosphate) 3'-pyrophosphohydrolase [Anaerolineales bacterium]
MKVEQAINFDQLMQNLPDYYNEFDRDMVRRAYELAAQAHAGQKRHSGEPYINHCVAVASILAEMRMPSDVVAAALLHDTVEDTDVTLEQLRLQFGQTIANLVDGVTKLDSLPRVSRSDHFGDEENGEPETPLTPEQLSRRKKQLTTETMRKTFLAMNDDVRVVLIKLADRLHNMRTLGYARPEKQKRIAQETLDIYAPLANRLGIWQVKWELEDLSFRYVNPEKYKEIAEQLADRRTTREQQIEEIIKTLSRVLQQAGIKAEISGRPKHIYSIYRKMIQKGKSFEMVRDIRGVRLLVADIPSCYSALGIIHTHWRPIPGEFDDYIAAPKDNFYQSLHTAVIYDDGKPLEVQIRTHEMHQNAEYGIAAHWRYKEGGARRDPKYEQHIRWLRSMMEWKQDVSDAQEFVDSMKTDVFEDRVYVFTPKGDIIDLPAGSTPIDFAYHVHTDVGHHCRGAKVDGKLVTLDYVLKTGQRVEILTSKQGGPSRDWLNPSLGLVKTQRARSKIRAWFKKQDREQNLAQGRAMLEREFRRLGLSDINLETLARKLEYKNPDEMFVELGCGDLSMSRIVNLISEQETSDELVASAPKSEPTSSEAVSVVGLRGLLTTTARCCNPTPGDPIIGYITRGRGATIHRQDCPNVLRATLKERERFVKVSWGKPTHTYPVPIRVTAFDRQGLMGDISNLLNGEGVNIADVKVKVNHGREKADTADIRLVVEVRDIAHLSRVLNRIENLPNVLDAQRLRSNA